MRNYFENPAAFRPMFTDPVSVRTADREFEVRTVGNFVSCGTDDPLSDGGYATTRKRAVLMIPAHGRDAWVGERPPSVGMIVETADFKTYAVETVEPFHGESWTLNLRECRA